MRLTLGNGTELLKEGATGSLVRQLQERLAGSGFAPGQIDGIFGPTTKAAVIAFQNSKHLAPDGIVGSQTWAALFPVRPLEPPPVAAPQYTVLSWSGYLPYIIGGLALFALLSGRTR